MTTALILLSLAVLALAVYAATLRARLKGARERADSLAADDGRFRSIAASVLAESRKSLSAETSAQLSAMLDPLRHNIDAFNRTIDEKYTREAAERFALREKIDELRALNQSLGREARELADALRGNSKLQGDWGEMILSRLLEQAGFTEGREFDVQRNFKDPESGADRRPDVVVHFPDRGCLVIDSKASLTAYVNLCAAADDTARSAARAAHVASVRAHVRELAAKNYQDFVGEGARLDFVMMFIPNEGAYIAALQAAPELWQEAYDRRVLIISPTHLFSVLKLVQQMWRSDDRRRNAERIALEAGKMYDKFVAFIDDMQNVDTRLRQAREAHEAAMAKLSTGRGNLVKRADDLRTLGARVSKSLPSDLLDE